jgi:hypothetical protein
MEDFTSSRHRRVAARRVVQSSPNKADPLRWRKAPSLRSPLNEADPLRSEKRRACDRP